MPPPCWNCGVYLRWLCHHCDWTSVGLHQDTQENPLHGGGHRSLPTTFYSTRVVPYHKVWYGSNRQRRLQWWMYGMVPYHTRHVLYGTYVPPGRPTDRRGVIEEEDQRHCTFDNCIVM